MAHQVRAWRERLAIPTYEVSPPNKNPMFLERRVYQGSSGAVYPLPVIDRVEKVAKPREWEVVFLENEYLRIMLMPELGGRVQMALDKTNDYHFVYYNRVIKPALVGLAGPWISGGIEFNWPQHHRPGTYSPIDCLIEEHPDGAVTVWMHEIDRMYGTRGTHGLRLRPGRAALEVDVRVSNRTSLPQTFLWWANPAVHVDENHQSVFPPDVRAVLDHGKRDVSAFPIARGTYYKVDYSPGTDISRYRNIPVPTSYMAYHSDYDFVGSYDHCRRAGLLHVADHHVSPGKKQWTWGNGAFGQAWDRQLTDQDGPYIELMCGVYTDNQPDFSWIEPGEEKRFVQRFMPYKGVGIVRNATVDAALGYEVVGEILIVRVWPSTRFDNAEVRVASEGVEVGRAAAPMGPEACVELSFELPATVDHERLLIEVLDGGNTLVACDTTPQSEQPIPKAAKAIGEPSTLDSVESLVHAALHLEQYRHATREPEDYYGEALRRDPQSAIANTAFGVLLMRRGRFVEAEASLRAAVQRLTRHNPNPSTGEAHLQLGHCLALQGRFDEAYAAFAKSAWNVSQRCGAMFEMARIACRKGDFQDALTRLDECLSLNTRHHQAVHLRVVALCELGRTEEAHRVAESELACDPFNYGVLLELAIAGEGWERIDTRSRSELNTLLETSLDCAAAGLFDRATGLLEHATHCGVESPLVWYYLGDFAERQGHYDRAATARQRACAASLDYCFPNKLQEFSILGRAVEANPQDGQALYLLGLLWFSRRQHDEAIACWERTAELSPGFATVWRNLGLAYFNKRKNGRAAWQALGRSVAIDRTDARLLYELDQLAKRMGHPLDERLTRLEQRSELMHERDDLRLEWVTLLNSLGRHQEALGAILAHEWRPWEGGEGKVPAQYETALAALATERLAEGRPAEALELVEQASTWPACLGEGKLWASGDSRIGYLRGVALQACGQGEAAKEAFEHAASGRAELGDPTFYNDLPPDTVFYQGLCLHALGRESEALKRFDALVEYGEKHIDDEVTIDFFAVSLPDFLVFDDDLNERNRTHCRYVVCLGKLGRAIAGQGEFTDATALIDQVLSSSPDHVGATTHRRLSCQPRALHTHA